MVRVDRNLRCESAFTVTYAPFEARSLSMNFKKSFVMLTSMFVLLLTVGCVQRYPPPPPAAPPPLIQLADHNGFETGRSDGAHAVESGIPFSPRHTRAYHDTPGYDPNLGPFGAYQNAFRNAYLRGYDKGYDRR
jgi:hypothetical protein